MARRSSRRGGGRAKPGLLRFVSSAQRRGLSQREALREYRAGGGSIRDTKLRELWHSAPRQITTRGVRDVPRNRKPPEDAFVRVPVDGPSRWIYHVNVLVSTKSGVAWQMVQVPTRERRSVTWAEKRAVQTAQAMSRYRVSVLDAQLQMLTREVGR